MGKKDKNKKKGKGAEKTAMKTDKKLAAKQKKMLEKVGETNIIEIIQKLESESKDVSISEEVCAPPSPRSSFTLISHPEKEELIMFGGEFYNGAKTCVYNDLYFYNIPRNEWKQLRSPSGPTPRSGHQMVSVATDGGQLWLFGGEHASPSQLQFYHYKDLWMMSLKTRKWEKVSAPNGPSARSGHRMVASKKRLFMFGGFHDNNQSYQYFNDVHVFSLESYEWLKVEIGGTITPSVRSGCCIAASPEGKIFVWGGYSKTPMKNKIDRGVTHTDMFVLTPEKTDNKYRWNHVKPSGYCPKPRSSVGFAAAANGKVYCYGGVMDVDENDEDVRGQFGSDLLALDLATQAWRLLDIAQKPKLNPKQSEVPSNSNMDTSETSVTVQPVVTTQGDFTMTVGGSSTNTAFKSTMPSLFPERQNKNMPSARMNPGMCVCKGVLYLFGGLYEEFDKQITLSDFYSLNLHKLDSWKVIIERNTKDHEWFESDESSSDEETSSIDEDDSSDDSNMDTD